MLTLFHFFGTSVHQQQAAQCEECVHSYVGRHHPQGAPFVHPLQKQNQDLKFGSVWDSELRVIYSADCLCMCVCVYSKV